MRHLMFLIGSFGLAICSVLLLLAVLFTVLVGRPLTEIETVVAFAASGFVGAAWWWFMWNKLKRLAGREGGN